MRPTGDWRRGDGDPNRGFGDIKNACGVVKGSPTVASPVEVAFGLATLATLSEAPHDGH